MMNIKKLIPLLLFSLLYGILPAQCPQEDIFLQTQTQVDGFAVLYPNCTEINQDLYIIPAGSTSDITDLNSLLQITSIAGYLRIDSNENLNNLNGLNNLISAGGLLLYDNDNLLNLNGLESLISLEDNFVINGNDNLSSLNGLNNLASINGDLIIDSSDNLTIIEGVENLISVGGLVLEDNDNLIDIKGLQSLASIGGVRIRYNPSLINLSGLENVTSLEGVQIQYNSNLNNIAGLKNVISIESALYITNNPVLNDLSGLNSLSSVGHFIFIDRNDGLTSLNGLDNLTSIGGDIRISNNESLINLNGIRNIDYEEITYFRVYDNPVLSICNLPNICSYFQNNTGVTQLYGNATGCSTIVEILANCPFVPKVKTDVFYDVNQDGIRSIEEPDYREIPILIEPISNFYYVYNDVFYLDVGVYTATLGLADNPEWDLTTDSISYFMSLEEGETDTISFGIYPTQQISHIQTTINSAPARCNERITLDVTTKNLGTTVASGTMWLTIDDAIPNFTFIHQPDTMIENSNAYGWYFTDLYPGQTIIKNVEVTVPGPPDFELGERLLFVSFSEFTDANGEDGSEGFRYNPEVLCSFDPNDKLVNPNREGDYVLFEEDLIYTVRFQNTGNDVAYDVVIRDTLDANLDLSTFRFLGSSHANRLNTILNEDEGILTFEFRDIFLPDSTSNFEASQGYVNYLIHTIDGLAEETPVTNSAGIYFDLNPPVITNTTQSIMVSELPTVSTETPDNSFNFNILPNPNIGTFTIQGIPIGTYQILNTSGQIIQQGEMQNDLSIDISDTAQGIYFISIAIDKETFVKRIVKM